VFIKIRGKTHYLWRAVDQDGNVLDILVTSRRDAKAATRFFRKLLRGLRSVPRVLVTDKLASYPVAHRRLMRSVEHRQSKYLNNRAENCEVGSRRGSYAPFPAPSSQTGHEVLPHPAFPWAVDRPHSSTPPELVTGPSDPRGSSTICAVLAVVVAHPARGPSLRRVVLSTPIIATTPSSDFRSTLHHFTGHAYRFHCYRSIRRRHPSNP
jgi:hypothetical protein